MLIALYACTLYVPIIYTYSNSQKYSPEEFREELLSVTERAFNTSNQRQFLAQSMGISAYDAVWTVAHAWHSVIAKTNCDNATQITNKLKNALTDISVSLQH